MFGWMDGFLESSRPLLPLTAATRVHGNNSGRPRRKVEADSRGRNLTYKGSHTPDSGARSMVASSHSGSGCERVTGILAL